MALTSHVKFEEKLACDLENDMRNSANFHQSIQNLKHWHFTELFLTKV